MDMEMEEGELEEFDEQLLNELGVSVVDRETFEQDFLDKLEDQFNENEQAEAQAAEQTTNDTGAGIPQESVNGQPENEIDQNCRISEYENNEELERLKTETENESESESKLEEEPASSKKASIQKSLESSPSKLKSLLLGLGQSRNRESLKNETQSEKQVRKGEMTPFGNVVQKGAAKKDSFLEFSRYMQNQTRLNDKFQEKRNLASASRKKKKGDQGEIGRDSDVIVEESGDEIDKRFPIKEKQPRKKTRRHKKDILDMQIMFPKKKKKKALVGTSTSEDPRDARKRVGKSLAETTGIYLNESEDSDYIPPSDSDCSEAEGTAKSKRQTRISGSGAKRKRGTNYRDRGTSDSEDYEDSDVERPEKKRKKLTDDGDNKSYKQRVENWKNNEIRFTGKMHTIDDGGSTFKIPMHLWESLYNYQKVGVKWLWELHQQRSGGILGDEMGLGKTIQVIAFLAGVSCSDLLFRFSHFRGLGPSLIVCPATVMHQWVREFHTWWPPFRVAILHDSGSYAGTKLNLIRNIHQAQGILVTTYAGVVNNLDELLKHQWDYIIVDEGHKIRNPDAKLTIALKQFPTPHRLILSGSPLQNHLKELWSLFDFIYPGKLGTLPVFMEQFAVPITQGGYANASEVQVAAAFKCATTLRSIINPYLLRRMKSDVNTHLNLPAKNEQVLFCKLTTEQREAYLSYLGSEQVSSILKGNYEIFVGLIYLRKICNHPHLYDGGPKIYKDVLPKRVPSNKVSMGFGPIPEEDEGSDIELDPEGKFGHWSKSGKMIVVRTLLKLWKKQGHKVLLFTQSRQMLCILENFILSEKYSYLRLDGSTSIGSRQPMIEKFNEDPSIFIFILTTKVGGLGVNLTGGNRVIIFDPDWNPSTDLQARERAWRIGQSRQVTIYRLITTGTIEEKIYHRQIFKQFLTNRVLKNPKQKRFFKSNDMMELFTLNEGIKGTETQAIFAGTGSNVKVPKRHKQPVERSTGKLKRVPYLVKQALSKMDVPNEGEGDGDGEAVVGGEGDAKQDDYVLRKLFKKAGVGAALRHDKIVDTNESDYLIVEKEAEQVAKDAALALKKSREQCWGAETGKVTWTGNNGTLREPPLRKEGAYKLKKKVPPKPLPPVVQEPEPLETSFFSAPQLNPPKDSGPMSSADLIAIIRQRNRPLIEPKPSTSAAATSPAAAAPSATVDDYSQESSSGSNGSNANAEVDSTPLPPVQENHMQLLRDIREFIAFRAMVDGQASTDELLNEFKDKLPPKDSPLFKKMLNQLCTHRQVEGRRLWRLKPEFR